MNGYFCRNRDVCIERNRLRFMAGEAGVPQ